MHRLLLVLIALLVPATIATGQTAPPEEALTRVERDVRAGTYGRVTSLLVTRAGVPRLEAYFDSGGAEARRNTRSATKTIAGMLVGLAIARGHLSGVDARVADVLKDLQPFASPDPRKDRDHRRGPPHDELAARVRRLRTSSRGATRSGCT